MAAVGDVKPSAALASAASAPPAIDNAAYLSTFPDVRSVTPVTMAPASTTGAPIFRSLFQADGEPAQPVSPAVRELWGNSSSLTSVAPGTSAASAASARSANSKMTRTPDVRAPQRLDLFSDRDGTFS
jgi:hypothetical protein